MLNILREAGGTKETLRSVVEETYERIHFVAGEDGADRSWQMFTEFTSAIGN